MDLLDARSKRMERDEKKTASSEINEQVMKPVGDHQWGIGVS